MSKRFTSFLVIVAAVLLALPTQAQDNLATKAAKPVQAKIKAVKPNVKDFQANLQKAKAAKAKAEDKMEGIAFRSANTGVAETNMMAAAINNIEQDKASFEKLMEQNMAATKRLNVQVRAMENGIAKLNAPANASHRGATFDEHGIIIAPEEGVEKTYKRSGTGYYYDEGYVSIGDQGGTVSIVETEDGTVYILDIISYYETGAWVKGMKSENTIVVPIGQPLAYSQNYDTTISLRWGNISTGGDISLLEEQPEVFTFIIDGDVITLQGTAKYEEGVESNFMGAFWDDDNSFSAYGDAETVWTLKENKPVDVLPYVNTLTTQDEFEEFQVIDANEDGKTWSFSSSIGTLYTYSSTNSADDWLVSPAILLEAGKTYRISLDARNSGYPERFEVKVASEATAAVLAEGQTAIASTDVSSNEFTTSKGDITVAENGYYFIGIHAISDPDEFRLIVANFQVVEIVGDAPTAVSDFTVIPFDNGIAGATIMFTAPTKNNGGEDLTENIAKIEILRDGNVINTLEDITPGIQIEYADNEEGLTPGNHTYEVYTYSATALGGKSEPITVFLSCVLAVPYTADFSQASTFDLFTVMDANDDGKTWKWNSNGYAYCMYSSENAADDYLITMPIKLEAGKSYDVIVNAYCYSDYYPERFEVVVGKEASAWTVKAIEPTDVTSEDAEDFEGTFSVEEDGEYFVAIHGISDADQYYLVVNSLSIVKGAEPTAPAAVTDFAAVAGAEGALEVNISFTAPAANVDGSVPEGFMSVNIYRDDVIVKTLENVEYGSAQTWKDENVEDATVYTYQVIPSNGSGEGIKSEKIKVYVGLDAPLAPENIEMTDNSSSITFAWDAVPSVGENGGYVNPATVQYNIWSIVLEEYLFWTIPVHESLLGSVTGQTTATVDFNTEEGDQEFKYFAVQAMNEVANDEDTAPETYTTMLIGKPYELPVNEGFEGSQLHYLWATSDDGGMGITDDASDEDGAALLFTNMYDAGTAEFYSGKINVNNAANPTLLIDVKSATIDKINVIGSIDGAELIALRENVAISNEYTTIKVPLADLKGGKFAQVGISCEIANPYYGESENVDMLTIDNIRIVDLYEYDLSAAVKAPASVTAGKTATITATIKNEGENDADGFIVTIKAGDQELAKLAPDMILQAFKKTEFSVDLETSIFDDAADVLITAEVEYENDLNPDNDKAETLISIKESSAPQPENLSAQDTEDGVVMAWSAPSVTTQQETEGFDEQEVFEPFSVGGITAEQQNGNR